MDWGEYTSVVVYMRLSGQFPVCLFFLYEKILSIKKYKSAKQMIFTLLEVFVQVIICCLCCLVFAYFVLSVGFCLGRAFGRLKLFRKRNINRLKTVLITSYTLPLVSVLFRTWFCFGLGYRVKLHLLSKICYNYWINLKLYKIKKWPEIFQRKMYLTSRITWYFPYYFIWKVKVFNLFNQLMDLFWKYI